jgi:hypothetical protein
MPMERTPVLPIKPFSDLFVKWGPNTTLSTAQLRLKVITLLAITMMLRPSDIAPKSVCFDAHDNMVSSRIFCANQVVFKEDGSAMITFHGIKNDTDRKGFTTYLPPAKNEILDPVSALKFIRPAY